jgi:hypothetical protein
MWDIWNIAGLQYEKNKLYLTFTVQFSYTSDPGNKKYVQGQ